MKKLLFILSMACTFSAMAQNNAKTTINNSVSSNTTISENQKKINKEKDELGVTYDTRFRCYKGDWSSPVPGTCPSHKNELLKDTDPKLAELIVNESKNNTSTTKPIIEERAEDNTYICMEGDYAAYSAGKCINHPNSELKFCKDPKTIELMLERKKSNHSHFKNIVTEGDIKYACIHTDYIDFKQGKCPRHNIDLLLAGTKEFIEKSSAISRKNPASTSNK